MNTGLQDAWNLVWKLDLALRARGGGGLLESYTTERRPVIENVIKTTDRLTRVMGTSSKLAQALRDVVIPFVSRLPPFQHAFVNRLSQLGVAYHGSPIVAGAGTRYFDCSLRGGKGIGSRFLMTIGDDADSSTVNAAKEVSESLSRIVELRSVRQPGVALVRPDGYLAYRSHNRGGVEAIAAARSVLERQVR